MSKGEKLEAGNWKLETGNWKLETGLILRRVQCGASWGIISGNRPRQPAKWWSNQL